MSRQPERLQWWLVGLFILAAVCVLADAAESQSLPGSQDSNAAPASPAAPLWLARCMVGEEGWSSPRGWDAIAHVLDKRHKQVRRRHPHVTFAMQVRAYCACLSSDRLWVRSLRPLPPGRDWVPAPEGWPVGVSWKHHMSSWQAALRAALTFRERPDPCPRCMHFGGAMDHARALRMGLVQVHVRGVKSRFYRVGT